MSLAVMRLGNWPVDRIRPEEKELVENEVA